jgi:hypothetical protein
LSISVATVALQPSRKEEFLKFNSMSISKIPTYPPPPIPSPYSHDSRGLTIPETKMDVPPLLSPPLYIDNVLSGDQPRWKWDKNISMGALETPLSTGAHEPAVNAYTSSSNPSRIEPLPVSTQPHPSLDSLDNVAQRHVRYSPKILAKFKTEEMINGYKDTPARITNLNGRYEHWIPAYVNDIKVVASPDNCSSLNIISEDFANRNKLAVNHTKLTVIRLPNKVTTQSPGSVQLKFRFDGEATIFDLVFIVLPSCVCDIVLSSEFLRITKTFTTFTSRVWRWYIPSMRPRPRVCLQGSPKQQVFGLINSHPVSASPDTGSDLNVISKGLLNLLD